MPKVKNKERILKASRENQRVTYKGVLITLSADFSKETLQARSIQSDEKQGPISKITLSSKAITQSGRTDNMLPRQGKAIGVHHHQAIITGNVKGTYLRKGR